MLPLEGVLGARLPWMVLWVPLFVVPGVPLPWVVGGWGVAAASLVGVRKTE